MSNTLVKTKSYSIELKAIVIVDNRLSTKEKKKNLVHFFKRAIEEKMEELTEDNVLKIAKVIDDQAIS